MKPIVSFFFPANFSECSANWQKEWKHKKFRIHLLLTLVYLIAIIAFVPPFFNFVQARPGITLNDFVLNMLPPRDMSLSIFLLIYFVILLSIINVICWPVVLVKSIQAYCLLMTFRIVCMYLLPLDPEKSIIFLQDPIIGKLIYQGIPISKDLFFSGHVSTMFLLSLIMPYRPLKYCFIAATLLVACFLLLQHVHYTIDIIVAPFMAWLSYFLAFKMGKTVLGH